MSRLDNRKVDELRKIKVKTNYIKTAYSSCFIEIGSTRVICTVSVENTVPRFLRGQGKGWITAEYGMLPASCSSRASRESTKGKKSGRTYEIQRLIGRSMRAVIDLEALGENTLWIDCDVIQADGGTRCASITGAFIALVLALDKMKRSGAIKSFPVTNMVSAISVGIIDGKITLDLTYEEDSTADVDMNIVMTDSGEFIEVQGTAEGAVFSKKEMDRMLSFAGKGITELFKIQKKAIGKKISI